MKKFILTIIAVAVASGFGAAPSRGAESNVSTSSSAVESALQTARAEMQLAQAAAQQAQAEAGQQYRQAREQFVQARAQIAQVESDYQPMETGGSGATGGGRIAPPNPGSAQFTDRLTSVIRRASGDSAGPGRTLVVRSGEGDPGSQAALEEDLAVMSHILDKTIAEKVGGGNRERTAMGINVYFGPNPDSVRNLYLDGYGALFTLKVNFPLLAPPKVSEQPKEKPAVASEWDEAKRELAGRDDGYGPMRTIPPRTMRYPGSPEPGEEFDEQKVSQLKDALLESLKSATNIRNMKADDSIILCVFGGSGNGPAIYRIPPPRAVSVPPPVTPPGATVPVAPRVDPATGLPPGSPNPPIPPMSASAGATYGSRVGPMPARGSILTIRVKKTDVDTFAKGKLDLDQFRKKASMTIYPIGSESANAGQRWEMY